MVTDYALPGFKPDIGVDVFTQNADGKNWDLCTQSPEDKAAAKNMSVNDYIKKGRHPMFYVVSFGEIFTAINEANLLIQSC